MSEEKIREGKHDGVLGTPEETRLRHTGETYISFSFKKTNLV